ncbi:MAG: diguanylate cyclase, partial [Clostridiales bacterium]|nr:diguanylate cyclase [Clostridiales bacterium]
AAIPFRKNEALIKVGYAICRHHHERYDGRGYPDGLKGDDIPIAAQVVALADVYDALTSERCYKKAFDPDTAVKMIVNGECGQFNPLLLECLEEISERLKTELKTVSLGSSAEDKLQDTVKQILRADKVSASGRSIHLFEIERQKFRFLSDISGEVIFEYNAVPELLQFSEWCAEYLGVPVRISDPSESKLWTDVFPKKDFAHFLEQIKKTSPEKPVVTEKYLLNIHGQPKWSKVIAKALWGDGEASAPDGIIGKIVDVNDETEIMELLEKQAEHDSKTGLLNHVASKNRIEALLDGANSRGKHYALAVMDLDNMKKANDEYGHLFGDEVLIALADRIRENIRATDIAARMCGDEFILFTEYK